MNQTTLTALSRRFWIVYLKMQVCFEKRESYDPMGWKLCVVKRGELSVFRKLAKISTNVVCWKIEYVLSITQSDHKFSNVTLNLRAILSTEIFFLPEMINKKKFNKNFLWELQMLNHDLKTWMIVLIIAKTCLKRFWKLRANNKNRVINNQNKQKWFAISLKIVAKSTLYHHFFCSTSFFRKMFGE